MLRRLVCLRPTRAQTTNMYFATTLLRADRREACAPPGVLSLPGWRARGVQGVSPCFLANDFSFSMY